MSSRSKVNKNNLYAVAAKDTSNNQQSASTCVAREDVGVMGMIYKYFMVAIISAIFIMIHRDLSHK